MSMSDQKIISQMRYKAFAGHKFSPKELTKYEQAVRCNYLDTQTELNLLYMCEALHDDKLKLGMQRITRILKAVNQKYIDFVEEQTETIDDVRERVYRKTGVIFAMSVEDQDYIYNMLKEKGLKVSRN